MRTCHATCHAPPRVDILVRVRSRVTIRECLKESNDLVFFLIRQMEVTSRHVHIVFDLRQRPAVHPFGCSGRAVPRCHWVGIPLLVSRVVEVNELFQALDVAVVEEFLLEVGAGGLGAGALRRRHGHVARRRDLHCAV